MRTYPGTDINSDHNPVVMKIDIKLKIMKKNQIREHAELNLLRHDECRAKFNIEIRNRYTTLNVEELEQQPENIEQI